MPIVFDGDRAVLDGNCTVEEAEPLLDWVRRAAAPTLDLSGCAHMHAALLQVLLAARPIVAVAPADAFLARICADLPTSASTPQGPLE